MADRIIAAAIDAHQHTGVDPLLTLAVAARESSMRPEAVSSQGAKGLMQVNERVEIRSGRLDRHGVTDLLSDIEGNVRVGAEILADYTSLAGNDRRKGLQFYHAGPYAKRHFEYYSNDVKSIYQSFTDLFDRTRHAYLLDNRPTTQPALALK